MIELPLHTLMLLCAFIFLAAFIDSIAGGGGLISLPAYLAAGLPPSYAAGTNKMSACMGTLTALIRFGRGGTVLWRIALCAAAGALPGAYIGASLLQWLPTDYSRIMLIVIIPLAAAVILLRDRLPKRTLREAKRPLLVALFIGLGIGFYDGLVGPGTGTFLIICFTALLGMDDVRASGSAKVVNLASNVAALVSMISGGYVVWRIALPAMACAILGGFAGSGFALKRGARAVRYMLVAVLILLMVKLIYDFASG